MSPDERKAMERIRRLLDDVRSRERPVDLSPEEQEAERKLDRAWHLARQLLGEEPEEPVSA